MWSLGLVEWLLVGNDGEARGAVLRVAGKVRRAKRTGSEALSIGDGVPGKEFNY